MFVFTLYLPNILMVICDCMAIDIFECNMVNNCQWEGSRYAAFDGQICGTPCEADTPLLTVARF